MGLIKETYSCTRCKAIFDLKFYEGGSIDHENKHSNHNLNAYYDTEGFKGLTQKYKENGKIAIKCMLIWLLKKDPNMYTKVNEFYDSKGLLDEEKKK